MERRIGIERLSVFGMPPVAFVELAASLDCSGIGIGIEAMRHYNPHDYPDWSLRDPQMQREMRMALRAHDVHIALLEGFDVGARQNLAQDARDLDMLHALGGRRINAGSADKDCARVFDGFARIAELAAERDIEITTEIGVGPLVRLAGALEAAAYVDRPNFRVLIDTMHYFRLGGSMAELADVDPALVGYVQLCDAPRAQRFTSYLEEAFFERMVPGEGELPLADFMAWLPADVFVSIEVPQRSLAEQRRGPAERLEPCVAGARRLMAGAKH